MAIFKHYWLKKAAHLANNDKKLQIAKYSLLRRSINPSERLNSLYIIMTEERIL